MPTSTITLLDTMEWAKSFNFGRSTALGDFIEPAKTSANLIKQTILSPPFSWYWNNQEYTFNASNTPNTSTITNVTITSGIITILTTNTFSPDDILIFSGVGTATFLNNEVISVLTANSSTITAYFNHVDYPSTADTGTLTNTSVQDYTVPATNFGWIEHASILDINLSNWFELEVKMNLALDKIQGRPKFISPHTQDSAGNVTFRLMPAPNINYPVSVHVQKIAVPFVGVNDTWAPIPDYLSYIYNWGFLSLMWMFADDPRFTYGNQKFVAHLLGAAQGMSESERNIFLNNWNGLTASQIATQQQGFQGRAI